MEPMLDIHTHILPEMDDGSGSVTESVQMLKLLYRQGVRKVVLTSHFYAEEESPESFLTRRSRAYRKLREALAEEKNIPELLLGAEVCYYAGISQTSQLPQLVIEGTDLLMLELPRINWGRRLLEEVDELASDSRFRLLLAHIDRYFEVNDLEVFEMLARNGVLMQLNAGFLAEKSNKRIIRKVFKKNLIHFMGSDAHGIEYRKPRMDEAGKNLDKYIGKEWPEILKYYEKKYF